MNWTYLYYINQISAINYNEGQKKSYLAVRVVILSKRQNVVLEFDDMFFAGKICWKFVVYKPVLQKKNRKI